MDLTRCGAGILARAGLAAAVGVFVGSLAGCASETTHAAASSAAESPGGPDASADVRVGASAAYREDPVLAQQLGAYRVFDFEGATPTRIIVSYVPRGGTAGLDAHVAEAHRQLLAAVPGKSVAPLTSVRADNPFARAGWPWRAFAYPTGEGGASICDAAAIMAESPGGFWTVSWNSNLGEIEKTERAINGFLELVSVESR